MSHSLNNTKAQLLVAIAELEQQNARQGRELAELRTQVSILQGELRLRPRAQLDIPGVTVERYGQRVIKRYAAPPLPVDSKV